MAAGTATLLRSGRAGSISEAGVDYEATFQVLTTDKNDGPAIVALANGVPRYGDVYSVGNEIDFGIRAKSIVPTQDSNTPFRWEVRVLYSSNLGEDPEQINQPNPTLRPAIVRWLHEEATEPMERDSNGTLVATANGEVFRPLPERTVYRPVLHVERNYLVFNDTLQFSYLDSVNSDVFVGGAARTWRCKLLQVDPEFENGFAYKRVIAEFVYKHDEWTISRLHEGFRFRATAGTTTISEISARKVPVFLDSTGVYATTASYLTFYPHREISFNALGLI
jgi:hypothetical protein